MANCFEKYNNNYNYLSSDNIDYVRNNTLYCNIKNDVNNSQWVNNKNIKLDICNNLYNVSSNQLHLQLTKGQYNYFKNNNLCSISYESVYDSLINDCKEEEFPELSNNYLGLDSSDVLFSENDEYAQIIDDSLNNLVGLKENFYFFNYPTNINFNS
jgi:hypothetical protein